jgi:flagellar basal-body rod protein FlgG
MNSSLRTSASGMAAQQRMVDVIANNIANVNTTGFKRSRVSFEDVLYETLQGSRAANDQGAESVGPVQIGKGVRIGAVLRLHSQGSPQSTERPLDVAIDGDGFFQVRRADGTVAFTRDGSFTLSESGTVVTNDGMTVLPGITVPEDATSITIAPDGTVSVNSSGSQSAVELGRLELARFVNTSGLQSIGGNLYTETPASGQALTGSPQEDGFGVLQQGSLETSNVEIVQEMTDMIAAQRAYEINAKAITAVDQMMSDTNALIR